MQPCPVCSNESATVWIALAGIVGVAIVWRNWPGKSWGQRLAPLVGCVAAIGAGTVACRSLTDARPKEPVCPCMTAEKRDAPPVFVTADPPTPPASVAQDLATAQVGRAREPKPVTVANQDEAATLAPQVIVYYFHRKMRCPSCLQIEEWAKQAVEARFATALAVGMIEWKPINVEEPGNEHFVKDYRLENQSLVMVSLKDGQPESWKNLEKVWDFLGDYGKFTTYVQDELSGMLGSASTAPHP